MNIDLDRLHKYAFNKTTGRAVGKSFYAEMQIASLLLVDGPKTIFTVLTFHQDIKLTIDSVVRILGHWGVDYRVNYKQPRIEALGKTVRFITHENVKMNIMM